MKKTIVVFSDTHGRKENVDELEPLFRIADLIVFLGDGLCDLKDVIQKYSEKLVKTSGNCDPVRLFSEGEFELDGVKFFYCHGDKYRVKTRKDELATEAKRRGCSVALFGHTHRAEICTEDGISLICPGSLRLPLSHGGTYACIDVENGKITPFIVGNDN